MSTSHKFNSLKLSRNAIGWLRLRRFSRFLGTSSWKNLRRYQSAQRYWSFRNCLRSTWWSAYDKLLVLLRYLSLLWSALARPPHRGRCQQSGPHTCSRLCQEVSDPMQADLWRFTSNRIPLYPLNFIPMRVTCKKCCKARCPPGRPEHQNSHHLEVHNQAEVLEMMTDKSLQQ